jgi:multiple sugar transport system permease protein
VNSLSRGSPAIKTVVYGLLALYLLVTIMPLYWVFSTTFKTAAEAQRFPPTLIPEQFTLNNLVKVFTDSRVFGPQPFANSLFISLGGAGLVALLSFMAGYGFARFDFPGRNVLLVAMLFINLIPRLATIIPIFRMFSVYGLYDTFLGLILLHGVTVAPFGAWLMKGYIDSIPVELDESAMLDGCTRRQAMGRIILPLAAPGVAATAIFGFRECWNDFTTALILTSSVEIRPYTLALYRFVGEQGQVDWSLISAATFISIVPVLVAFGLFQKHFVSGLTGGALKS